MDAVAAKHLQLAGWHRGIRGCRLARLAAIPFQGQSARLDKVNGLPGFQLGTALAAQGNSEQAPCRALVLQCDAVTGAKLR
jgi:hypothetical protein